MKKFGLISLYIGGFFITVSTVVLMYPFNNKEIASIQNIIKEEIIGLGSSLFSDVEYYRKSFHRNGQLQQTIPYDSDDLIHGIKRKWYKDGTLDYELEYEHGKPIGLEKEYWSNGNIRFETPYENGVRHGDAKLFYQNGKFARIKKYRKGKWSPYAEEIGKKETVLKLEEIIQDEEHKLIWDGTDPKKMNWRQGDSYCKKLKSIPNRTWRLPTKEELTNIMSIELKSNTDMEFWASDYNEKTTQSRYLINMKEGTSRTWYENRNFYIRCVSSK